MRQFDIFLSALSVYILAVCQAQGYVLDYGLHRDIIRRDDLLLPRAAATPSPVQSGQVQNCVGWRYVQSGDTCDNIVTRFQNPPTSLTKANLLAWNPALKSDCSGLTLKTYVCVQVGAAVSTTTTRTTTTTSTQPTTTAGPISTPTPIQAGQTGNCIGWRYVQGSDTCANIVTRYASLGLTQASLIQWNPALKSDCSGLTTGYYVCVRIDPSLPATKTTTTSTTTTATTTTVSPPPGYPTPIQAGQVSNCVGWRYVAATDTCPNIVSRYQNAPVSLTLANLLKWNPALGNDCSGLTPKYYVCVQTGTATSSTTTTTTTSSRTSSTSSSTLSTTTTTTTMSSSTTTSTTTTVSTTTTTTGAATPTATLPGQVANCIGWRYLQASDTCDNLVSRYQAAPVYLTRLTLLQFNPALDCSNLPTAVYVCVRVQYWIDGITHRGKTPYAGSSSYQVYRNVKDFGAKGDGSTDDTVAIQNAISSGSRCGLGCDSTTTKPALIYFPPGTYMVSAAIQMYYNSHLIGDPITLPRIKATAGFSGAAVIDADPYGANGNWHGSTNNFYKVVRNFIVDTTAAPANVETKGIHWQGAQATSLNNIVFYSNNSPGTQHKGLYMEDGSGGYISDLVFNGGQYCAQIGNQQFTLRNLIFNNCGTGLMLNWGWAWHFKSLTFNNVGTGIDMTASSNSALAVGSVVVADSRFNNVQIGVKSQKSSSSVPETANSLVLDNISINNCPIMVGATGNVKLAGSSGISTISMWAQGRSYSASNKNGVDIQSAFTGFARPAGLLDATGKILERSKPQYATLTLDQVLSARDLGCTGDGSTDDTATLQAAITRAAFENKVLYIDYGVYLVSNTIYVPPGSRIMGEVWPLILGSGTAFMNANAPVPIVQFGRPGESGFIEGTNFIVGTRGPMKGAVLMEWNLAGTGSDVSGLYDVHARVGGFQGSNLDANTCLKTPSSTSVNANCAAAFMLMRVGRTASRVMLENVWLWTADHDLDLAAHSQISVFTGRGLLVESTGPVWLYGTASEHNVLYQYQFSSAQNVYMGLIQTESPYYQSNPVATAPFSVNSAFDDPDYSTICPPGSPDTCKKSYGLRIKNSSNILCYGAALYSFFENYTQQCLTDETCQTYMTSIESSTNIRLYNTNTKGSRNILTVDGSWSAAQGDNVNTFAETVALYQV
ncbi:hypothetical protein ABW21_db0206690 [Orbilia brochopaga]|nr:hypothetical protein ABW21_db0206690 [Drechslerella brochopaga]